MIHDCIKDISDIYHYLQLTDRDNLPFYFVLNETNPDYLIATEQIYTDDKHWNKFVELSKKSKVNIYRSLECTIGDLNVFDYFIGFDKYLECGDRVGRTPTRMFFSDLIFRTENDITSVEQARELLKNKGKFCNFIYSNSNGHVFREELFYGISRYCQVDSLGQFLNNTMIESSQYGKDWNDAIYESISLKKPYKFSIACENAKYEGYTSEKIFSSMEAHTVPIYWGNPDIENEVNSKAFINCFDYSSMEELVDAIKNIDEDDELWCEMIAQPWLTTKQLEEEKKAAEKYEAFINNIFMQPIDNAKRRGEGFHPSRYTKWFFSNGMDVRDKKNDMLKTKWIDRLLAKKSCSDYLVENKLTTIAIYGAGKNCELLLKDIDEKKVTIKYIIDKNKRGYLQGIEIINLDNIKKEQQLDAIVVSLPYLFEKVKELLEQYTDCEIISIEELVKGQK